MKKGGFAEAMKSMSDDDGDEYVVPGDGDMVGEEDGESDPSAVLDELESCVAKLRRHFGSGEA